MANKWLSRTWVLPPTAITALLTWQWRHFQLDDALIYLRYVRNFLEGNGLVYNVGELFNGLTSPLYVALLTATSMVTRNPQVSTILLSACGLLAASLLGGRLFSKNDFEAGLVASMIASLGYFYLTFGMETTLLLALLAGTLLLARRASPWVFILAALAISTRVEAVFLAIPAGLYFLYKTKKLPPIGYLIGAVAIFVSPFLANWAYYGTPLPGTAAAKFGQGASGYWGDSFAFLQVQYLLGMVFAGSLAACLFLATMAVAGIVVLRKDAAARISWVYLALLGSFYLVTNMPDYHWYYAPFIYLLLIYAATAIARLTTAAAIRLRQRKFAVTLVAVTVLAATAFTLTKVVAVTGQTRIETYARIGNWLNANTPPTATIAAVEIGTLGWYSHRPIVDILGLVNEHNAEFVAHRDLYSWMYYYQPDYILCHKPEWTLEPSCSLAAQTKLYLPDVRFKKAGFVLLARQPGVTDQQIIEAVKATRPK